MSLLLVFARTYPRQTLLMFACLLLATIEDSERERETRQGKKKPKLKRQIRLDQVGFSYRVHPVLYEVSLTLPVGRVTVIIGPSGTGKTTITDLLVGVVQPQIDDVWLDDLPLSAVDP